MRKIVLSPFLFLSPSPFFVNTHTHTHRIMMHIANDLSSARCFRLFVSFAHLSFNGQSICSLLEDMIAKAKEMHRSIKSKCA